MRYEADVRTMGESASRRLLRRGSVGISTQRVYIRVATFKLPVGVAVTPKWVTPATLGGERRTMVKVFIQGMRRSGTTILFDLLGQDPRFDLYYEPFSITRAGHLGGGSGEQSVDFAARIRALREEFCRTSDEIDDPDYFNYGAPRDPSLELETELSPACVDYLQRMLDARDETLIKFVRMFDKIATLRRVAPLSRLIHVVRDPRRVVASQMLGPNGELRDRFPDDKSFFRRRGKGVLWGSRHVGRLLTERPEFSHLADTYDVRLILLVWRYTFRRTFDAGRDAFGEHYLLVRHEELATYPEEETRRIYAFLGIPPHAGAIAFGRDRLRPAGPILFESSRRWNKAIARVGLERELRDAGYENAIS